MGDRPPAPGPSRHRLRFFAAPMGVGLVLMQGWACSDDPSCHDVAQRECEALSRCQPGTLLTLYGDLLTCQFREALECEQVVHATGTRATPRDLESCSAAKAACPRTEPRCDLPRGSLAPGSPCQWDTQCNSGKCEPTSMFGCGVCSLRVGAGAACKQTSDCEDGLYCATGACAPELPLGTSCSTFDVCAHGLTCNKGTCVMPPGDGDLCSTSADCLSWTCIDGVCRNPAWEASKDEYGLPGGTCGPGLRCLAGSCEYCGFCGGDHPSVCLAYPIEGQNCLSFTVDDVLRHIVCMPPAVCSPVDYTCVLPNEQVGCEEARLPADHSPNPNPVEAQ